jgi:hypothetical protein
VYVVLRRLSSVVMAVQMRAHTFKQRLCFNRQMRSLLKFVRNMSCAVGDWRSASGSMPSKSSCANPRRRPLGIRRSSSLTLFGLGSARAPSFRCGVCVRRGREGM